jgi:hypothetical protein
MSAPPDVPPRRKPRSLSTYALVLVGAIAIAGTLYLALRDRTVVVYGAAQDLPAYHQITEPEVRRLELDASDVPQRAVRERDLLIGHYTLRAVRQDKAIDGAQVGPELATGALAGRGIVGFAASSADVLDGAVARGDRVNLLFAKAPAATLDGALVLDVRRGEGDNYVVVVAVGPGDRAALGASLETARPRLVRVSTYERP